MTCKLVKRSVVFYATVVCVMTLLSVNILHSQDYHFDGSSVEVHNSTKPLILQFYYSSVNLAELYQLTKTERSNFGIAGHVDPQYGPDGYVEIRVYDYDDEKKNKGRLIYGARAEQGTSRKASGYMEKSWKVVLDKGWIWDTKVASTDIKALSQHENVGSVCTNPSDGFWSRKETWMAAGTLASATFFTLLAIPVVIIDPPGGAIMVAVAGWQVFLGASLAQANYSDYKAQQEALEAKYKNLALKYQNQESGKWCDIINPSPRVLIELEVKNARVDSVAVPGMHTYQTVKVPPLTPARLLSANPNRVEVHGAGLQQVATKDLTALGSDQVQTVAISDLEAFPIPNHLITPLASSAVLSLAIPDQNRLLFVATEKSLGELVANLSKMKINPTVTQIGVNEFLKTTQKSYYLYSLVVDKKVTLNLGVDLEGPFLAGYDFHITSARADPQAKVAAVVGDEGLLANDEEVIVFPNPARESFSIQFRLNQPSDVAIRVATQLGETVIRTVSQRDAGWQTENVNISKLKAGVYTLQFSTNSTSRTMKIVKE